MEHRHSEHVAAEPDRLFAALADVSNLPHYVPQIREAHTTDKSHVEVEARYEGHTQHGEAWFRADESARRIEWGLDDGPYHGALEVTPDGDGSLLTLELTTVHGDFDGDIAHTLDAIRRLVEADV
jgi:polyketide cyclase/dehydrase/lipid transport protein